MGIDLRYPNITEGTEREQIHQLKTYLYTLVDQLQYVIGNFDTTVSGGSSNATGKKTSGEVSYDPQILFSDIKALIIKSADIVNTFYEKLRYRFEGVYVAQSDFGAFKEQTLSEIEGSSTSIDQHYANIQEIASEVASVNSSLRDAKSEADAAIKDVSSEVGQLDETLRNTKTEVDNSLEGLKGELQNINYSLVAVSANLRSGLLYYDGDGIPVYGLEVGQKTMIDGVEVFDKFARFTSDRLSFYDNNDNEVAYISDRKLYINHAEVTGTFRMGGFVRTVLADGSTVKRWTKGGEG